MEKTLYEQLGAENLSLMVNYFYDLVVQNEIISSLFKTDMEEVKRKQTMFLTQFFGGPPLYIQEFGHPRMRMRHMPHKITSEGAMEWLECMHQAIEKLEISEELKTDLFNRFQQLAAHMVNSQ